MLQELRYAFRSLRKTPGFAATAVLILGAGIGVNVTIFTLVSTLLLQPPNGVREPGQLVRINRRSEGVSAGSLAYPDYAFFRDEGRTLSGLAAYGSGTSVALTQTGTESVDVQLGLVSGNYFEVLGTPMAAGRSFLPEEDRSPETHPVAVISARFWQAYLGGAASVVGRTLSINGHPLTIVGVVAPEFRGIGPAEQAPDIWVPIMMQPVVQPSGGDLLHRVTGNIDFWIQVIGRLRTGGTVNAAREELTALARQLETAYPEWNKGVSVAVTGDFQYTPRVRARLGSLLGLLTAAAATVLAVACANIALLLLARASARRKELGVRMALGAGRLRVARQLLAESLLIAGAGSAAGMILAAWAAGSAGAMLPLDLSARFEPNLMVLGFATGLAVVTALTFGLLPAWQISRTDIVNDLKEGAPGSGRSRIRSALVTAQVALSLVLVAAAGLFVRSLVRAKEVDLGFATENRVLARVNLQDYNFTPERSATFLRSALERIGSVPGVQSVSTTTMVALGGGVWTSGFGAEGAAPPPGQSGFDAGTNAVGPGYFATMGIPLARGRDFAPTDDRRGTPVVIVNEALAQTLWGAGDPLGRTVSRDQLRYTVIGVAHDAKYYELGEDPQAQLYFSELQLLRPQVTFVVRTDGPPATVAPAVRREILGLEPNLAIASLRTYDDVLSGVLGQYQVVALLASVFGGLALMLALAGLHGMLSYLVVQGKREIAVRMALGAQAAGVARGVVGRGLILVGVGVAAGLLALVPLRRVVSGFLFGIPPGDPVTLAMAVLALVAAAAMASYLPARRAASVQPMEALRNE